MGRFPINIACSLALLLMSFVALPFYAQALDVIPVQPSPGQVFNSSNNVTFTCNATDDGQLRSLSLFHNLNGTFSANQTERYGEAFFDSNTSFLCNFNGNLSCQASGNGLPDENQSLSFDNGKFSQGVRINETGILRYQTSGNFDRNQGTIEFWIKPGNDFTAALEYYILHVADSESTGPNEMMIYISGPSGTLHFEIRDESETSTYDTHEDVSSWQIGTWYHVTAVWDLDGNTGYGDPMLLYTNGSDQNSAFNCEGPCNQNISYTNTSSTMHMGSNKNGLGQINATLDDFRISRTVRSASEINKTYYEGLINRSSVSESWQFTGVPDGSYLWKCLAYDNDSETNSSSDRAFYVDISTPPSVNWILLTPNSSDGIDPGVSINVTANVSDPSGVSTAILQWKKVGDWSNITMAYNGSSGLYENASFQTDVIGGEYYYRVWANDSKGNSGYSQAQNATVAWDFTWSRFPLSLGTVSGLINSVSGVGTLAINNTGDDTLNFTLSHNWPLPVYFNGSESGNFYVPSHSEITVNITAQFASSDSENDMVISISASHPTETPSPLLASVNATMNSYSGGPYLSVSIMEYTSMASQSQTFNLTARVKNIGNETAENVWLNWSLPSGWSNTSGNTTQFIGNLNSTFSAWNSITVYVNPSSASPGTFMIYANSSCSQNASDSDSRTVGVSCSSSDGVCGYGCSYVNDNECSIPSAPGGAGTAETVFIGGGGEKPQFTMVLEAPSLLDIQRGEKRTLTARVTNTGKKTSLQNITLSLSGYPLTLQKISPPEIERLEYSESGLFELELSVPGYMKYGIYNLSLAARGAGTAYSSRNLTRVEAAQRLSLVIHSVQENETKLSLEATEAAVKEMQEAGLGTEKAQSLLEKARSQISEWDYDSALENLKKALEIRENSFRISGLISQVGEKIREAENYGIAAPESRKMSSLSKSALSREDYAKAEERAESALTAYFIESQGLEASRFLYSYWWALALASLFSASSAYLLHRKTLKSRLRRRMESLSREERAARDQIARIQGERYREKTLSGLDFHRLMAENAASLAKIRRRKSRLAAKMIRLGGRNALEGLREQEMSIRKEIQGLQKKYYEEGGITRPGYQKTLGELREELAESLRNMERIEERRKGQSGLLAPVLVLLSLVVFAAFASGQQDERQAALDAMVKAEGWIMEMGQLGFPAIYANDTLNEARLLFSKGFYKGAESLAKDVESIKNRAISLDGKADETESYLYEVKSLGIEVSGAEALFSQGLESLRLEDYGRAEELFDSCRSRLEELEAEASIRRAASPASPERLVGLVYDNIAVLSFSAAVFLAASAFLLRRRKRKRISGRIRFLEREAESVKNEMKGLQQKYFQEGSMGKGEYELLSGRYAQKLAAIKRKIASLKPAKPGFSLKSESESKKGG